MTNVQTDAETRDNHPTQVRVDCRNGGGNVARGASMEEKMLKNDERSRNVYENKYKIDNFTEAKGDICSHMTTYDGI